MAWHEQNFDHEIIWGKPIFRNLCDIDLVSGIADCIDLNPLLQIVSDGYYLRVIALNVDLLYLSEAEPCDVTS